MAYLTCSGDTDFSAVPGLISMGKVIPMEEGCAIATCLHVHICQTLLISKLALGMGNLRIRGPLDTEDVNRGIGMLEARLSQRHMAGVFEVSKGTVPRMWEQF